MTKRDRQLLIEIHCSTVGATRCPPGTALKGKSRMPYWRRRGSKGTKSARSPFFVRGEGCV